MSYPRHFTVVGFCSLLLTGLSGCTWLIPEDPSTLRYNSVLGERHVPAGNRAQGQPAAQAETPQDVTVAAAPAPVMPQVAPMPVAPAAPAIVAVNGNLPPAGYVPPSVSMPDLPPVDALTQSRAASELGRQTPVENGMYQTAQNSFTSVPYSPPQTGADAPLPRLNNVRRDLEGERAQMQEERNRLSRDAAAEGSMLAPAPAPVSAPVPPAATTPVGPGAAVAPGFIALPPPPPLSMGYGAPVAPAASALPAPQVTAAAPAMPMGGFDPMAVNTANASSNTRYATNGFMAQSRYKR